VRETAFDLAEARLAKSVDTHDWCELKPEEAASLLAKLAELRDVQMAAIVLCNAHRWSYGGAETLRALAQRVRGGA
jgi:hypothetical protein